MPTTGGTPAAVPTPIPTPPPGSVWIDGKLYAPTGSGELEPWPPQGRSPTGEVGPSPDIALGWRFDISGKIWVVGVDGNADLLNLQTGELNLLVNGGPEAAGGGLSWKTGPLLVVDCPTNDYLDQPGLNMDLTYGGGSAPIFPLALNVEFEAAHSADTGVTTFFLGGSPMGSGGAELGGNFGASYVVVNVQLWDFD